MKVRVLGCSGAIARDCRTTSFLVDETILIDAGTGVGDLTLQEMQRIDHVFLTHSHLDHLAALPLMIDAVSSLRKKPLRLHALPQTIEALKAHIFNNVIWPDFSTIPSVDAPWLAYEPLLAGQRLRLGEVEVEALPAVHTVAAVGYAVSAGRRWWVFSGDTERNPAFWQRVNALTVEALIIETAFSHRERELARRSLHLSPDTLAQELALIAPGRDYPIYITHTKPSETERIMDEIHRLTSSTSAADGARAGIHLLTAGQVFDV